MSDLLRALQSVRSIEDQLRTVRDEVELALRETHFLYVELSQLHHKFEFERKKLDDH